MCPYCYEWPRYIAFDEENELKYYDLTSMQNHKNLGGVTFRAPISEVSEGVESLELARI